MNERFIEEKGRPEELLVVERLILENKFTEAIEVLRELEKKEELLISHKINCFMLQARLLMWIGKSEECIKIAKKAYKANLTLGNSLNTLEILGLAALVHTWQGRFEKSKKVIKKANIILKSIPDGLSLDYIAGKANFYFIKGYLVSLTNAERGMKYLEHSLSLWNKIEPQLGKAMTIMCIGLTLYRSKGALDQAINYYKEGLSIAKDINNKYGIAFLQFHLGNSYHLKGEFNQSLYYYEQSLQNFKEINNKSRTALLYSMIGGLLSEKGDYNQACEYLEKSLAIYEEIEEYYSKIVPLGEAISLHAENGNINLAREYLQKYRQIAPSSDWDAVYYEALILKKSQRMRDKFKAEELFRGILEKANHKPIPLTLSIIIHLCDIYLYEFYNTNNLSILEDIDPLIDKLRDLSENTQSFLILCETYILQAKLALITLDLESARTLLTKGQEIAERYDLQLLAIQISEEHDKLIHQLNLWENLKKSKASLQERLELAQLNEKFNIMHKRILESPKQESDQPILLIIISESGDPILYNHFTDKLVISENQIIEFLSSFHRYCDQIFSKTFDRVKLGEYTVLIRKIQDISLCYIFQGQTYSAQQKLNHFFDIINKEFQVREIFTSLVLSSDNEELPLIKNIINQTFLSDIKKFQTPFKAYMGKNPFVFVSYSHIDKFEVYPVIERLNETGINVWYDEGIPVSENWKKSIATNLEKSATFLVFISPNIVNSEYVRKEISFALKKKKPFFAVYLKETKLPTELEFEIADIQAMMKYLMPKNEFYEKLNEVLKNSLNKKIFN